MMDPRRVARATGAARDGEAHVEPADAGMFRVHSFTRDARPTVQLIAKRSFACLNAAFRTVQCKHIAAALLERGG